MFSFLQQKHNFIREMTGFNLRNSKWTLFLRFFSESLMSSAEKQDLRELRIDTGRFTSLQPFSICLGKEDSKFWSFFFALKKKKAFTN